MWTAVNVSEVERDIKDEYKTKQSKNSVYIVNDNSFNSYESSELDSVSELGNNPLLKPAAGVTEVTSRAEGSLGALRRTVVKFVVHNKEDFDNNQPDAAVPRGAAGLGFVAGFALPGIFKPLGFVADPITGPLYLDLGKYIIYLDLKLHN